IALVVLGPEKLPDAVRKFTKTYAEFKKTVGGFQNEFRNAMDEPMRELRETANAVRDAAKFDLDGGDASDLEKLTPSVSEVAAKTPPASPPVSARSPGLNFGSTNPRRQDRIAQPDAFTDAATETSPETTVAETTPTEDATE
ncbi:MAG: twin-arginine translocase TatA/TatE family subunit, partial [Ilumatobacteraceae bacterium]|nr:twin-arginine translocase TatA/TatE family subunit [Ilumatobacteraceae bacterium]